MDFTMKPTANPIVVLREEFDDWAILFDPDTAEGCAINPVGVFIWKKLDGKHTVEEIAQELKLNAENAPDHGQITEDCREFIDDLIQRGLAGHELTP